MAGFLPGILVGLALLVVSGIVSIRNNYGREQGDAAGFAETIRFYGLMLVSLVVVDLALVCFFPLLSAAFGALGWAVVEIARGIGYDIQQGRSLPTGAMAIRAVLWGLVGLVTLAIEVKVLMAVCVDQGGDDHLPARDSGPAAGASSSSAASCSAGSRPRRPRPWPCCIPSSWRWSCTARSRSSDLPGILLQCGVMTSVVVPARSAPAWRCPGFWPRRTCRRISAPRS